MTRSIFIFLAFALLLTHCGSGGSDDENQQVTRRYVGTLSGENCSSEEEEEQQVTYVIVFESFTSGAPVTLNDQDGVSWSGSMLSSNSFIVSNPSLDPRFSITVTEIIPSSATGVSVSSCEGPPFCCTSLEGRLNRQ